MYLSLISHNRLAVPVGKKNKLKTVGSYTHIKIITLNSQVMPACCKNGGPAWPASNNTVVSAIPWDHKIGVWKQFKPTISIPYLGTNSIQNCINFHAYLRIMSCTPNKNKKNLSFAPHFSCTNKPSIVYLSMAEEGSLASNTK